MDCFDDSFQAWSARRAKASAVLPEVTCVVPLGVFYSQPSCRMLAQGVQKHHNLKIDVDQTGLVKPFRGMCNSGLRARSWSAASVKPSAAAAAIASSRLPFKSTPSGTSFRLPERTMFSRPFSGRPLRSSQVRRPIITGFPMVTLLKYWRSVGSFQGSSPPRPMARSSATATPWRSR